jgi:hypothetical protein
VTRPDPGLAGVKAAIDNLTSELTAAIQANTDATTHLREDVVAAIDRLIEAQPQPSLTDWIRAGR